MKSTLERINCVDTTGEKMSELETIETIQVRPKE